jgi:hypothetical protein
MRLTRICIFKADSVVEQPLQYSLCIAAARINTEWTVHILQILHTENSKDVLVLPLLKAPDKTELNAASRREAAAAVHAHAKQGRMYCALTFANVSCQSAL